MTTLHHLITDLEAHALGNGNKDVLYLVSQFNACEGTDWKNYITGPGNVPIFQNEDFRLVLIYWDGHARSKKHGHPEGGCLLKVLSGTLIETRFDPFDPQRLTGKQQFFQGDVSYIHDALACHVVENPSPEPAISLHIYSPGIYNSKVVQPDAGGIQLSLAG